LQSYTLSPYTYPLPPPLPHTFTHPGPSLFQEKEAMKKRAGDLEAEVRNRCDTSSATERLIRDKDEQIAELLEEGEKLSKQQLQSNNIIKKLRAKEKENDHTIKTQR
jgi:hypothetical protein